MLNRAKLLRELNANSHKLFNHNTAEYEQAHTIWRELCGSGVLYEKIASRWFPVPIPLWYGELGEKKLIDRYQQAYRVLAIDGSQIYPDRHFGNSCYLINVGSVLFNYHIKELPGVVLNSEPHLFFGSEDKGIGGNSIEIVNLRREELELGALFEVANKIHMQAKAPLLSLTDGTLIFWYLESKDPDLKELFFNRYMAALEQLYQQQILYAGYISMPRAKEVSHLIRAHYAQYSSDKQLYQTFDSLTDSSVMNWHLSPGERSAVFKSKIPICSEYPSHLEPHFCYMHVGTEIGRIEIPSWIAQDEQLVNLVCALLLDQCHKGGSYPISLAEAHEQAVVKGPDREFFYHMFTKLSVAHHTSIQHSSKQQKKNRMRF